jgi:hypothetical protein
LPRITSPAHLMRWLSRVLLQRGQAAEPASGEMSVDPGVDPGADFAARVVARVELRWSHRRRAAFGGGSTSRRRADFLLPVVLAAAVIAVVVLTLWWSGALRRPVIAEVSVPEPAAANGPGQVQAPPAAAANVADAPRAAPAASARPRPRDANRSYTVIAMPPRHESRDPSARASLDAFYTALLSELREAPRIALLIPGVTAPPSDIDRPADYLLTVTSLDVAAPVAGGLSFRVTDDWGGDSAASTGLPSAGIASLQGRRGAAQWPVEIRVQPIGQPDSAGFTSILQIGAEDMRLAAQQAEMLRRKVFPDLVTKLQLLARLRDGALPAAERSVALEDLLDIQQRDVGEELESADIATILEHASTMRMDQRAQLWRSLRRISHPDLVEPLLDSARRDVDESVRFEALATLAANHGNESKVRAAIEAMARQDTDEIVRMAARRALQGEPEWRAFIVTTLEDARLSYGERLMPLVMAVRSATTPAETQAITALLKDGAVLKPLVNLVREGWYETAEAGVIADAVSLLANAEHPAASDLFVQVLPEQAVPRAEPTPRGVKPAPPQLSPEAMAWLQNHRNDARVRRILQDVADGKVDQQLIATVELLRRYESMRPRIPRRP